MLNLIKGESSVEDVKKVLLTKSKRSKMEQRGKFISFLCIALIVLVVLSIFYFVASKGLATFFTDKINVFDFLFGTDWNPSQIGANGKPMVGALPMITGSFIVTFLSAIVATPFAIGAAVFMTEISPKNGTKILQPVIELLVGIPSVVYGFIGLSVIVPFVRSIFGGTGCGILAGTFVLFVMILPTVTTMTVDAIKGSTTALSGSFISAWCHKMANNLQSRATSSRARDFNSSRFWYGSFVW